MMILSQHHSNKIINRVVEEVPMIMQTVTATSPPQHQNEAVAQARLELLSNTALLKRVMDSEANNRKQQQQQQKKSTMENTPSKVDTAPVPAATNGDTSTKTTNTTTDIVKDATMSGNHGEGRPSPVAEIKINSSSPKSSPVTSPAMSTTSTNTSATVSPVDHHHMVFVPPSTSYASLLLPTGGATSPAAAAGLSPHQLQSLALAHHSLPQNVKTAMAMMATGNAAAAQGKIYGGPSSAFQKPFIVMKENMPPSFAASATSPIISRQTSPTGTQSPGETSSREGPTSPSYEALLEENRRLQQEMKQKDETIATLQTKADGLEKQIFELRQLPTGKISHIPIE